MAVLPPFVIVTAIYVLVRTLAAGRTRPLLESKPVRITGLVVVSVGTVLAALVTIQEAADII
jgi:hypothetical protein